MAAVHTGIAPAAEAASNVLHLVFAKVVPDACGIDPIPPPYLAEVHLTYRSQGVVSIRALTSTMYDRPGGLSVGDRVRVRPGVNPSHGWGEARDAVGVVASFDSDGDVRVNFPRQANWCCVPSELEVVASSPQVPAPTPQ